MNAANTINILSRAEDGQGKTLFEIPASNNPDSRKDALNLLQVLRAQAKSNGVSDLSLDEINEEIRRCRRGSN